MTKCRTSFGSEQSELSGTLKLISGIPVQRHWQPQSCISQKNLIDVGVLLLGREPEVFNWKANILVLYLVLPGGCSFFIFEVTIVRKWNRKNPLTCDYIKAPTSCSDINTSFYALRSLCVWKGGPCWGLTSRTGWNATLGFWWCESYLLQAIDIVFPLFS